MERRGIEGKKLRVETNWRKGSSASCHPLRASSPLSLIDVKFPLPTHHRICTAHSSLFSQPRDRCLLVAPQTHRVTAHCVAPSLSSLANGLQHSPVSLQICLSLPAVAVRCQLSHSPSSQQPVVVSSILLSSRALGAVPLCPRPLSRLRFVIEVRSTTARLALLAFNLSAERLTAAPPPYHETIHAKPIITVEVQRHRSDHTRTSYVSTVISSRHAAQFRYYPARCSSPDTSSHPLAE